MFIENTLQDLKKHFIFLFLFSMALSFYTATFSHMNNWLIFKASFFHLLDGQSLYIHYPQEHHDLYKYSPTFALLMAPLSILPANIGATMWNLLGALLFAFALVKLPVKSSVKKGIFWVSLPEFIGSTQGFQSNIHMIALLALFWSYLEEEKAFPTALCILLSFFIKIFGIIALILFLFSKYSTGNFRFLFKFILSFALTTLALIFLPSLFIGLDGLEFQYLEWVKMLKTDITQSYGFSAMGVFHAITGWHFNHLIFQLAGAAVMSLCFLWSRNGDQATRQLGFISVGYFLILFNHRSESSTFIIAMMVFGLHQALISPPKLRWSMIIFTLGCVSFMYSDLFREIKKSHLDVLCVKAWPFLFLWPMGLWAMLRSGKKQNWLI
ncbi:MAG: DUF2029 domain-containing protein [Bdellovibrionales bacterium]|nr:DUF2029 domain-containing protein [Bdellovibrionales bacterium]NQZ19283.1 DUF2029 domain-containing protein [Bdellovibrionales bacterium]